MSAKRLAMRKIKEVLRLKFELGFGHRHIARASRFGPYPVRSAFQRASRSHAENRIADRQSRESVQGDRAARSLQ